MAGIFGSTKKLSGQTSRKGASKEYHHPNLLARLDIPLSAKKATGKDSNSAAVTRLEERLKEIQSSVKKNEISKARRNEIRREIASIREQLAKLGGETMSRKKYTSATESNETVDPNAKLAMAVEEGDISDLALRIRGEPDIKGEVMPRAFPVIFKQVTAPAMPDGR